MNQYTFSIDSHVIKNLMENHGVYVPCKKDFTRFVESVTEKLSLTDIGTRGSWNRKKILVEVSSVLAGICCGHAASCGGLVFHSKKYRFQLEIEHQILVSLWKEKQWGSRMGIFAYLITQAKAICGNSGVTHEVYLGYLRDISDSIFADFPQWSRPLIRIACYVGSQFLGDETVVPMPNVYANA